MHDLFHKELKISSKSWQISSKFGTDECSTKLQSHNHFLVLSNVMVKLMPPGSSWQLLLLRCSLQVLTASYDIAITSWCLQMLLMLPLILHSKQHMLGTPDFATRWPHCGSRGTHLLSQVESGNTGSPGQHHAALCLWGSSQVNSSSCSGALLRGDQNKYTVSV